MRGEIQRWVERAAERAGGQAALARLLTKHLHADYDRSQVQKMCSGKRGVSSEEMIAIEDISAFPYPRARGIRLIPVIDWISAGKLAKSEIPLPEEPIENQLRVADLGMGEYYALKVQGNSMDRVSPEGSIILVNRSDVTLVSGKYYIFCLNAEATYKRWHGGDPAYLEPFSTDPSHGPIFVKNKKGLAVLGRVKRTILDL